jgi:hypothetical protein
MEEINDIIMELKDKGIIEATSGGAISIPLFSLFGMDISEYIDIITSNGGNELTKGGK